jgi:hypothetical protein
MEEVIIMEEVCRLLQIRQLELVEVVVVEMGFVVNLENVALLGAGVGLARNIVPVET